MGNLQGLVFSELEKTNPIGYNILITQNEDQEIPVSTFIESNQIFWYLNPGNILPDVKICVLLMFLNK
jgi:hypothetical protein